MSSTNRTKSDNRTTADKLRDLRDHPETGENESKAANAKLDALSDKSGVLHNADGTRKDGKSDNEVKVPESDTPDLSDVSILVATIVATRLPSNNADDYDEKTKSVISAVLDAYRDMPVGNKSKVRNSVDKAKNDALRTIRFDWAASAQFWMDLLKSDKATQKRVTDPNVALARKLLILHVAATMVETGMIVPERGESDTNDIPVSTDAIRTEYNKLRDSLQTDEPTKVDISDAARKLAATRLRGENHDVEAHVRQVFAKHPKGTWLLISEIANETSEEYGTDNPSDGAVSARLFPSKGKCNISGIVPEMREHGGKTKKGAYATFGSDAPNNA